MKTGFSPHLVRPELVKAMKAEAHSLLPPLFADIIERMEGMYVQAIYDPNQLKWAKDGLPP